MRFHNITPMFPKTVEGSFEYQPELAGQTATLVFKLSPGGFESWVVAAKQARHGDEAVLRYEGLTVYLKLRADAARWMIARPEAKALVATLSLTSALWDEVIESLGSGRSLDLRGRMEKKPWNNLQVAWSIT